MFDKLMAYHPSYAEEERHLESIKSLISNHPDRSYYRDHFDPGHVTGSGLLISADGLRVLLNHHKSLNKWLCFGGHADGEKDILNVALREVIEESGIEEIEPVTIDIWDVDVHGIPANPRKNEPAHKHFDIRYLFRVKNAQAENFKVSDESNSLRWCNYEEALSLAGADDSMVRLFAKWQSR